MGPSYMLSGGFQGVCVCVSVVSEALLTLINIFFTPVWTVKPGVLQSMGSDTTERLN